MCDKPGCFTWDQTLTHQPIKIKISKFKIKYLIIHYTLTQNLYTGLIIELIIKKYGFYQPLKPSQFLS